MIRNSSDAKCKKNTLEEGPLPKIRIFHIYKILNKEVLKTGLKGPEKWLSG